MSKFDTTMFKKVQDEKIEVKDVIDKVFNALEERGYNPINQFVGYMMSGDPSYITSHNNARSLIRKVERDEIIEQLLKTYLEKKKDSNAESDN